MKYLLLRASFILVFMTTSCFLSAATVEVGPLYLDSVSVVGPSAFGLPAGVMELKITNGFVSPAGMNCDINYLDAANTIPNFKEILSVLLAAHIAQKPVRLGITNDVILFGNRCTVVSVALLK